MVWRHSARDAGGTGMVTHQGEHTLRYRGWRIVAAMFLCQVAMFGFGLYGQGVYLSELRRINHWPTGLIAAGSTSCLVLASLLAVFVSDMLHRFGPRKLTLAGSVCLSLSLALLGSADTLLQLYAGFIVMALAWTCLGTVAAATIVGAWFDRRRGLAISITFMGASVSGILLVPALVALVEIVGFRRALDIAALAALLLLLPVAASLRLPDRRDLPPMEPPLRRIVLLRDAGFCCLTGAFAAAIMVQVGFIVHQIAILEPLLGFQAAGGAVALTTAMALFGRIAVGAIVDRVDVRRTSALSILSQALALLMIATARSELVIAACAVFGFSIGNLITLPALIIQREWPPASFGTALGLSMAIAGVINACGPAAMGLLRDASGGYVLPLFIGIAMQVAAAIAILAAPRPLPDLA